MNIILIVVTYIIGFIVGWDIRKRIKQEMKNKFGCWTPVEKQLPNKMGFYICKMGEQPDMGPRVDVVFFAIREPGSLAVKETGWGEPVLYGWANNTVTHWMPMPELKQHNCV